MSLIDDLVSSPVLRQRLVDTARQSDIGMSPELWVDANIGVFAALDWVQAAWLLGTLTDTDMLIWVQVAAFNPQQLPAVVKSYSDPNASDLPFRC